MVINLKIPDELFEHYVKKFGLPRSYQIMKMAVEQYKDVDLNDRYLMLAGDDRRAVEAVLGTTIETPAKLIKLISNMNHFKIGDVQVNFTDDELARLSMQATFHGRTMDTYIREMASEIKDRMLEKV